MAAIDLVSRWTPVVLWAAMIFTLSSIPDLSTGLGAWDTLARKILHVGEFAVLGALCLRALGRPLAAGLVASAYAAADEVHQSFVEGRAGSPLDWAIDTFGVVVGILFLLAATR